MCFLMATGPELLRPRPLCRVLKTCCASGLVHQETGDSALAGAHVAAAVLIAGWRDQAITMRS